MSRLGRFSALATILLVLPGAASGQLSDRDRSKLVVEIHAAAASLDEDLFPDLIASKTQLLERVDAVHRYFTTNTGPENCEAWLAYLDLDPLVATVKADESPVEMASEAAQLRQRLVGTAPGLELTALRNLRDSVEQLIESVRFRDGKRSVESLEKRLEALAKQIEQLDASPSPDDFAAISALLGILDSSGQAQDLVRAFKNVFSRPNVTILIGGPLVGKAIGGSISRTRPVRDCILGTRIVGDATLTGNVSASLLPSTGTAAVHLALQGQVVSHNVGYNGPIRLRTVGHADVNVSRTMTIDESGVRLGPTFPHAVLKTDITAIEHHLGLVRRIARKKAAQQKPQADRIAVARLRKQVESQFASETSTVSPVTPSELLAKYRPVLTRLTLEQPSQYWSSTENAISIDSVFRRHDQLSSVVSRPPITETFDAAVQIHESAFENAFAAILAGRTLKEERLNELLQEAGREIPDSSADAEKPEPPFEIDFSRLRPVIFEARDQTVRFGFRGTRFAQGSRELKQAMEITAIYEPAKRGDGAAVLLRTDTVDVSFPGRKRLTISQAGLKRTIQKKFSQVFPEIVLDRPLTLPSDAKIEALRGLSLRPRLIDAKDGWLTIAIR